MVSLGRQMKEMFINIQTTSIGTIRSLAHAHHTYSTCMHIRKQCRPCTHIRTDGHTHTHARTHVHTHTHTHTHVHTHTHTIKGAGPCSFYRFTLHVANLGNENNIHACNVIGGVACNALRWECKPEPPNSQNKTLTFCG